MNEELKPCPFCGSKYVDFRTIQTMDDVVVECVVECEQCGAEAGQVYDNHNCKELSAELWNTRHPL